MVWPGAIHTGPEGLLRPVQIFGRAIFGGITVRNCPWQR